MSGEQSQKPVPPSADQVRMFLQMMQQQLQTPPQNSTPHGQPPKSGSSNSNGSEKQSPTLDENNMFDMLMNNPDYQRLLNYGQMGSANPSTAPVQHPLAAAAANPDNPAFRALIAHSNGVSGLPFSVYPNFVPEMHPDMLAANPYYANGMPFPYIGGLDAGRRKNATRDPNKAEKMILAIITKMSLTQVSTWFANARRRLKKENKMTWSPRCRPGDEEDDDDINDPPSPSISIHSSEEIKKEGVNSNSFEESKGTKRSHPKSDDHSPTPKRKILSVNDMLSNNSRQSPTRSSDKCKSPQSTTPPSSSSNGAAVETVPNVLPQMGQFSQNGQPFPFPPFMAGANPAQPWTPQQMMAMLAQNAARTSSAAFPTVPPMNPNLLQQMMAFQQMSAFMRPTGPMPPQLNPMLAAMSQGFFPGSSANTTSPKVSAAPNRPSSNKPSADQAQSPSVVNTSSSSVSEGNMAAEQSTNEKSEKKPKQEENSEEQTSTTVN